MDPSIDQPSHPSQTGANGRRPLTHPSDLLESGEPVFLDNAAGTPILRACVERYSRFCHRARAQLGGPYHRSGRAHRVIQASLNHLCRWLDGSAGTTLVAGQSVTTLLRHLADALADDWSVGDEVIVSRLEHMANANPWLALKRQGVRVRWWSAGDHGRLEADQLRSLITPGKTRLICMTHASHVTGAIQPVADIVREAHAHGIPVCVDGTALAAHRPVQLSEIGADYYALSLFKCYGPQLALLAIAPTAPRSVNERLQTDSFDYAQTYAATAVADFYARLADNQTRPRRQQYLDGYAAVAEHETALLSHLYHSVGELKVLRTLTGGPVEEQAGTLAFRLPPSIDGAQCVKRLADSGIAVRYGRFNAPWTLDDLGEPGVLRISVGVHNSRVDIDRFTRTLRQLLAESPDWTR